MSNSLIKEKEGTHADNHTPYDICASIIALSPIKGFYEEYRQKQKLENSKNEVLEQLEKLLENKKFKGLAQERLRGMEAVIGGSNASVKGRASRTSKAIQDANLKRYLTDDTGVYSFDLIAKDVYLLELLIERSHPKATPEQWILNRLLRISANP